ncbi:glycosyltransferase [Caldisericum exile]|uniref:glycosyltransferase n=1 Tax=Caldisericum exile TaxID=693075 RepID=UPI003C7422A4
MTKDVLFLSSNRYGDFPSRKTRFSKYLSENGFRVVYVDSPHTYLAYLKKDFKVEKIRLEKVSENFYVLRTFPILPFFKKYPLFNKLDEEIYFRIITSYLNEISFKPNLVFTYIPFFPQALKRFGAKVIYDCVDDHASFGGLINPQFVNELERRTVKISDVVITTGNSLLKEKLTAFGKAPIQIPNGVDYALFSKWLEIKDVLKIKKQIVYVGAISSWFDLELIKFLSEHLSDFEILLIGFTSVDISALLTGKNIKFLGKLTQESFAPILWESSVAIIPFKLNDLTKKIDPLKAYEYLASGLPVVSTPVGNVSSLPIYVAQTKEEFLRKVELAISEDSIEKRVKRAIYAKEFSWENRNRQILDIVEELIH